MAVRPSVPDALFVPTSTLPINSIRFMAGGGGNSAAVAANEISSMNPAARRSDSIVVVLKPIVKIQIGEKFRVLVRREQLDVAYIRLQEIRIRRGEPQQAGDGEHHARRGETA